MHTPKQGLKLVVGLGNPGPEYKNTYHNAGISFVEYLGGLESRSPIPHLLGSAVFMNASGPFVKKTMEKYAAEPEELLVAHDDSDLYIGEWKLSFDRGAAGHKGVESVIRTIGTKAFWRVRIGIRPKAAIRKKAEEFVLKNITKENGEKLKEVFKEVAEALAGLSS